MTVDERQSDNLRKIQEISAQRGHFFIRAYCNPPKNDCPAREVEIYVKDIDGDVMKFIQNKGKLRCPICAALLELREVLTAPEHEEELKREARCSVNVQIYLSQQPEELRWLIPPHVLFDDSLPGTHKRSISGA